ncbi:GFA domain-containing protein [Mycena kentingensis (nom. inval.)]|nr:GFA domain-containing protein [Mycena kentingensis (nom. inval.)]
MKPMDSESSNPKQATATCFCGAVQLSFPTEAPGLAHSFICHCKDCYKITASFFGANFSIAEPYLTHVRGRENLKTYADPEARTIDSGHLMTNCFCGTCGTLMYRIPAGYPGFYALRLGTVDDYEKHEEQLRPRLEQYTKSRAKILKPIEGLTQYEGMADFSKL